MKKDKCASCEAEIEVPSDYEPEHCCNGWECGCYGLPLNPMFCHKCEEQFF